MHPGLLPQLWCSSSTASLPAGTAHTAPSPQPATTCLPQHPSFHTQGALNVRPPALSQPPQPYRVLSRSTSWAHTVLFNPTRFFPQIDFLGESTEGNLHLHVVDDLRKGRLGVINVFGMQQLDDIYTLPLQKLKSATQVRRRGWWVEWARGVGRGTERWQTVPGCKPRAGREGVGGTNGVWGGRCWT